MSEPPAKRPTFSTKLSGMAFMRRGLPKDLAPVVEPEAELVVISTEVAFGAPVPAASCVVTYEAMPAPAALYTRMSFKGFNATTERLQADLVAAAAAAVAAAKARITSAAEGTTPLTTSPLPHTSAPGNGSSSASAAAPPSHSTPAFLIPGELQAINPGRRLDRSMAHQSPATDLQLNSGEQQQQGSMHVMSLSGPSNDGSLASLSKKRKSVDPAGKQQQQGKSVGDANVFAPLRAQRKK